MRLVMPTLYVILDAAMLGESAGETARKLIGVGVRMLQYRSKDTDARGMLAVSTELAGIAHRGQAAFFVNDRPDVAYLSGADGVHVGQEDLSVEQARTVVGAERWVGTSTHSIKQFEAAITTSADYIAVGPIFATSSKANPDPVVGIELIRRVRSLTTKPIVAIGGITLENAAAVIEAGADSVAVISDILRAVNPAERARQYIQRLEAVKPAASH